MLDCYMALTVPYSVTLARRLAEQDLHFTWMEEFLPPDAYDGYEETGVESEVMQGEVAMDRWILEGTRRWL